MSCIPVTLEQILQEIKDKRSSEERKSPESDERPVRKVVVLQSMDNVKKQKVKQKTSPKK